MSEEYQRGYAEGYESGALDIHKAVRRAEAAETRAAELLERVEKLEASFQAERQELSKSISLIVQGYSATEEKLNEQVTDLTAQNARLSDALREIEMRDPDCECPHETDECCAIDGHDTFCAKCIAGKVLRGADLESSIRAIEGGARQKFWNKLIKQGEQMTTSEIHKHSTHDLDGCYGTDAECPCPKHEAQRCPECGIVLHWNLADQPHQAGCSMATKFTPAQLIHYARCRKVVDQVEGKGE